MRTIITRPLDRDLITTKIETCLNHIHFNFYKELLLNRLQILKDPNTNINTNYLPEMSDEYIEKLIKIINEDTNSFTANQVLIVEDEETIRDLMAEMISTLGVIIHKAEDGQAGLEIIDKHPIDLALCDRNMPRLDGLKMFEIARKDHPDLEGVLISGDTSNEQLLKAVKIGMVDYISKPAHVKLIIAKIKKNLIQINARNKERLFDDKMIKLLNITDPNQFKHLSSEDQKAANERFLSWVITKLGEDYIDDALH